MASSQVTFAPAAITARIQPDQVNPTKYQVETRRERQWQPVILNLSEIDVDEYVAALRLEGRIFHDCRPGCHS